MFLKKPNIPKRQGALRIAILADMPRHSIGGNTQGRGGGHGATWLPQLADAFAEHEDLDVIWITLDKSVKKVEVDVAANQHFIRVPLWKATLDYLFDHWPSRIRLTAVLKQLDVDIVHAWGTERFYPSVFKSTKAPKILSIQGALSAFVRVFDAPWTIRIQAKKEPKQVMEADVLTCESLWSEERIREIRKDADIRIIDYGVHPSFYKIVWRPDPERPVLLYSGDIDYRKGLDVLMDALEKLPDRNWVCKVAGDGPMAAELKARNIPGVEWLGNLPWSQLQVEMSKAWALVVPTRADTGPTVVKEARVVGLPIIGTENGGLRDYIRDGESGYVVRPLTVDEMAKACKLMMSDYDKVVEMGRKWHHEDKIYFNPERTADAFISLYKELSQR